MDSENAGDIARKEPGEKQRDRQLVGVGFSRRLEPKSAIIGFEAQEAERGAGV
jgi:hypothetical protein